MRAFFTVTITVAFSLLSVMNVIAQERITPDSVQGKIFTQLAVYPQEKMHLHTDRNLYVPGEKIWFKAYIVDAFTHQSPTYSRYAYIELINSSDELIHRVMITGDEEGLFHGYIFLSELIPEGDYTLRAYTRYMENLGEDYFFKRHIRIAALKTGLLHPDGFAKTDALPSLRASPTSLRGTKQSSHNNDYEVSFYPEGGYLTEGVSCRVAFKALDNTGAVEAVTGVIVDEEGNRIGETHTIHSGMGSFTFTPEAGKVYYLDCKNPSGQEKRFQLPAAQKTYTIAAGYNDSRHLVEVIKSPGLPDVPLYLVAHCKGEILYYDAWNYRERAISFSRDRFPSGVIQLMLFDSQMNPVSERLIFNKRDDQSALAVSPDKPYYEKRDKVSVEIKVIDTEGNPLAGHASIAVTDDKDVEIDTGYTILSSLLLSSELRGYIESPGYYLRDEKESEYALDLLMLTHGWRRYDLSEAMKGHYAFPQIGFEAMKEITGSVRRAFGGRPVANGEVLMLSSQGLLEKIETDADGRFTFYVHPPDSVGYKVQARGQRRNESVDLIINPEQFPEIRHVPKSSALTPADTVTAAQSTNEPLDFMKKAEQRSRYNDDMRMIQLDEVTVTAKVITKRDELRLRFPLNEGSDVTIYREEIEKRNAIKITELLKMIPGVLVVNSYNTINNDAVYIRGSQIYGPGAQPLVVIDGVTGSLGDLTVHDVETIDVFKGSSASNFGVRGMFGVISITTRRGISAMELAEESASPNVVSLLPLGFQKPVEFYAPRYDTLAAKNLSIPDYRTTIFWKPDVLVDDDGKASIEFYTADFPTTCSVVIEGISNDGRIIRQVETIEVK